MLQEWKTTKAVVRVIISDMKINLAMLIDDFTFSMREGDGDIYYTISLSEYRTLNVPSVQITTKVRSNGLLSRPAPAAGGTHTVVSGDTLWGISKNNITELGSIRSSAEGGFMVLMIISPSTRFSIAVLWEVICCGKEIRICS